MTEEYDNLLHKLFTGLGANSRVNTPITVIRPHNVKIWNSVIIMNGCLMMSAGGITIDDDVQIAANAQLYTIVAGNHFRAYGRKIISYRNSNSLSQCL